MTSIGKILAIIGLCAALGGCSRRVWYRPGAGPEDFASDRAACKYEALKFGFVPIGPAGGFAAGIEQGLRQNEIFNGCMEGKGWRFVRPEDAR